MAGVVLGRDKEHQRLGRFLESLKEGPAGCVLEGEAGIGKTALWREGLAAAQAGSFRVLSCAPAESESRLSYSSLTDLLAKVEPHLFAALPAPQRHALEVALLRAGTRRRGRWPAGSRDGCGVAARRVGRADACCRRGRRRPVARLALRRGCSSLRPGGSNGCPSASSSRCVAAARPRWASTVRSRGRLELITVGPMSPGALHQLIKARLGSTFSRATLLRIHRATAGNPFFALELASSLVAGRPARGGRSLPCSRRSARVGRAQAEKAAGDDPADPGFRGCDARPDGRGAAPRAQASHPSSCSSGFRTRGSNRCDRGRGRARPLHASVVRVGHLLDGFGRASEPRAHRRLASLATDAEQRARHLALCTEEPDSDGGAHGGSRSARGSPARRAGRAAELAELAVLLTPANERRRARPAPARTQHTASSTRGTRNAPRCSPGRQRRSPAGCVPGRCSISPALDYWGESARAAVDRCEQALVAASGDPGFEGICHAELAVYCDFDVVRCERHARLALELLGAEGEAADVDALADALLVSARASLLRGRGLAARSGRARVRARVARSQSIYRSRVATQLGQWLKYVDDFAGSRSRLEEGLSAATREGDESAIPNALMHLAQLECWSGNWPLALRYAEESFDLAEQLGQTFGGPPAYRALVDAHLGNVDRARTTVTERLEVVEQNPVAAPLYLRVLGFLELSLGNARGRRAAPVASARTHREHRHPGARRLSRPCRPGRGSGRRRQPRSG